MSKYHWPTDRDRGTAAEKEVIKFLRKKGFFLRRKEDESHDAKWYPCPLTKPPIPLEIKSCFQAHKTGNACVERWSDYPKQKIGGPWQTASKNGHSVYCYAIWKKDELVSVMLFWTEDLIEFSDQVQPHRVVNCENKKWLTVNYLYPLDDVAPVAFMIFQNVNDLNYLK